MEQPINIEPIVKKARKPRMSNIVSKAVLLKQMSDSNLEVESMHEVPTSSIPDLPIVSVPVEVPIVEVPPVEVPPVEIRQKSIAIYRCELCDVNFKSDILFKRHPTTHRHISKLQRK